MEQPSSGNAAAGRSRKSKPACDRREALGARLVPIDMGVQYRLDARIIPILKTATTAR
jgi:hypothetical protein